MPTADGDSTVRPGGLLPEQTPGPHVRERVVLPMLDIMDGLVGEVHRHDPHPYGHHNHHLCILVREWHDLLDTATDSARKEDR